MDWITLKDLKQLDEIRAQSKEQPVLIYKHSSRCSISRTAFDRLERKWDSGAVAGMKRYFLDLISYREVSNQIAEQFLVEHQSPQILVIKDGQSILDLSHYEIDFEHIRSVLSADQPK
ncbi:MAG TPA: bacillithiol system redox-active protein YtxJ [Chryseosolibacter sp.]